MKEWTMGAPLFTLSTKERCIQHSSSTLSWRKLRVEPRSSTPSMKIRKYLYLSMYLFIYVYLCISLSLYLRAMGALQFTFSMKESSPHRPSLQRSTLHFLNEVVGWKLHSSLSQWSGRWPYSSLSQWRKAGLVVHSFSALLLTFSMKELMEAALFTFSKQEWTIEAPRFTFSMKEWTMEAALFTFSMKEWTMGALLFTSGVRHWRRWGLYSSLSLRRKGALIVHYFMEKVKSGGGGGGGGENT